MEIDFEKVMVLVLVVITLIQFLATRKMITSEDIKEIIDRLKPDVEKSENKVDDILLDIAAKLSELLNKPIV